MSWIAAPAGLYARFKHEATAIDPQEFSYNRVFAFDENGNALIIDHAGKTLMPAKDITNFDGLSEHGGGRYEITQAIPAPPGLRWVNDDGGVSPIVAYGLATGGDLVAMVPRENGWYLSPIEKPDDGHLIDEDGQQWGGYSPPSPGNAPS